MTVAADHLRRLMFAWLMLCVAGAGVIAVADPVAVAERDVEAAEELYVSKAAGPHHGRRSRETHGPRVRPATPALVGGPARATSGRCDLVLRRFPSLRASNVRIQV